MPNRGGLRYNKLMANIKYSHKNIKISCVFVSVILVLITLGLGATTVYAAYYGRNEIRNTSGIFSAPDGCYGNLMEKPDVIDTNAGTYTRDDCMVIRNTTDVMIETDFQHAKTRTHITVTVLLVATILSLVVDLVYFSLLGIRLPDLAKNK